MRAALANGNDGMNGSSGINPALLNLAETLTGLA
jgi:hypothetical protein